jgi:hypothetical protein
MTDPTKPAKRPPHRPKGSADKFTPEVRQIVLNALKAGQRLKTAADAARISVQALQRWRRQGLDDIEAGNPETEHACFYRACKEAQSMLRVKLFANLIESGDGGDWRASEAAIKHLGFSRDAQKLDIHLDARFRAKTTAELESELEASRARLQARGRALPALGEGTSQETSGDPEE